MNKAPQKHKAEEFLSRFRSKEDLYRYLTQQRKVSFGLMGVFSECFPSVDERYEVKLYERHLKRKEAKFEAK